MSDGNHIEPRPVPLGYQSPSDAAIYAVNRVATAGLVFALLGCIPGCGLLGIIFGTLGVIRSRRPEVGGKGRRMAIQAIVLGCLGCLLLPPTVLMLARSGRADHPNSNRVKCASNLRQIGQAMMLYAIENSGHYPDSPARLFIDEDLTRAVFICPSSNDTPAPGATKQAQAAQLLAGGHDSYVYLGKGYTTSVPADAVMAYELPANHGGTGSNVLFGDGHVNFIPATIFQTMLAQLKTGQNPPPATKAY